MCIPRTQTTPIFEGQPPKTRPFPIKTGVIWVPGSVCSGTWCYKICRCFSSHLFGGPLSRSKVVLVFVQVNPKWGETAKSGCIASPGRRHSNGKKRGERTLVTTWRLLKLHHCQIVFSDWTAEFSEFRLFIPFPLDLPKPGFQFLEN